MTSYKINSVKKEDIIELRENLNDPEVCKFLYVEYPVSLRECVDYWTQRLQNPFFHAWAARTVKDNKIAGVITLTQSEQKKVRHNADLSLVVGRLFWNKGVGSDLVRYVLQEAKQLGITRIGLSVVAANEPAVSLYKKNGFVIYGRRRCYFRQGNQLVDDLEMELLLE